MNYGNIAAAVDFYRKRGYVYVPDVPWTVGRAAYHATKPPGATDVRIVRDKFALGAEEDYSIPKRRSLPSETDVPATDEDVLYVRDRLLASCLSSRDDGFFVASGEQGFIQMMLDGQELKRAVCVTPCFRVERYDHWHLPYFMKAELINAHDTDEGHLIHMVHEACSFFEHALNHPSTAVRVVKTGELAYDIVEKSTRIELGSYGIREITVADKRLRWIYGTACAEPRLSRTRERLGEW